MVNEYSKVEQLYQHLGAIFYCIAVADKELRAEEVARIRTVIEQEWIKEENRESPGQCKAFEIETVFEWCMENGIHIPTTLDKFESFIRSNPDLFTRDIRLRILRSAYKIAGAFHRNNKSELVILAKLDMMLAVDNTNIVLRR